MKSLRIDIPEDLVDYFEYIPQESLPSIVLELIREGLNVRTNTSTVEESKVDIESILKVLTTQQVQPVVEEEKEMQIVQVAIEDLSDLGDLDDFADLLK